MQKDIDLMPYKIVKADNGDAWVEVRGKKIAPQQVSAEILRKMKKTAEDYLGEEVTEAVITVPAYFNDSQRQATKDAGRIAGLEVKRIINEPTAAALAFGMDKKERRSQDRRLRPGRRHVRHLDHRDRQCRGRAPVRGACPTNGDTFLGGEDFDQRLIDYIVTEFKKRPGRRPQERRAGAAAAEGSRRRRRRSSCRRSQQTEINLPYITADKSGPKHLSIKITRAKFESLVEDLIERTIEPCRIAIKDAGVKLSDVGDVILVGGMTRMPKVQDKVKEFFGKEPRKDVNPDEAVAVGAAIQARRAAGRRQGRAAARRDAAVAGHRDAGWRDDQAHPEEHDHPDQGAAGVLDRRRQSGAVTIHVLQGERDVGVGQQEPRPVQPGRHSAVAARHAADRGHASTSTPTASCTSTRRTRRPARKTRSPSRRTRRA